MPTPRRRLGTAGEQHARRYCEAKGWHFIAANWHCPKGEIDLIMRDAGELVFVEVKTRHGEQAGRAEDAVTRAKSRRLLVTAEAFVAEYPALADMIWRIDILAITLSGDGRPLRISHIENAVITDESL